MLGAICVVHRSIGYGAMWTSLALLKRPCPSVLLTHEGTNIARQRNAAMEKANELGADWVLFVDDDQVFPDLSLVRLLSHDEDLVGAFYLTRVAPHRPVACIREDRGGSLTPIRTDTLRGRSLVPVAGLGMGFTLIRRRVWRAMEPPWFRVGHRAGDDLGEDLFFCSQAAASGFQPYLDAQLTIGHLSVKVVTPTPTGDVLITDRSQVPWRTASGPHDSPAGPSADGSFGPNQHPHGQAPMAAEVERDY